MAKNIRLLAFIALQLFVDVPSATAAKIRELRRGQVSVAEKAFAIAADELVSALIPTSDYLFFAGRVRVPGLPPPGKTLLFNTVVGSEISRRASAPIGACSFISVSITAAETSINFIAQIRGEPGSGINLDQAKQCLRQYMTSSEFKATPITGLILEGYL